MHSSASDSVSSVPSAAQIEAAALQAEIQSNAGWLFWIGGLTLVNTVLIQSGSDLSFALGLLVTLLADSLAAQGELSTAVVLGFDAVLIGLCVLFGIFARRGARWAFICGLLFFGADSLLLIPIFLAGEIPIVSAVIHAWAIFALFKGLGASHRLVKLDGANPFTSA